MVITKLPITDGSNINQQKNRGQKHNSKSGGKTVIMT